MPLLSISTQKSYATTFMDILEFWSMAADRGRVPAQKSRYLPSERNPRFSTAFLLHLLSIPNEKMVFKKSYFLAIEENCSCMCLFLFSTDLFFPEVTRARYLHSPFVCDNFLICNKKLKHRSQSSPHSKEKYFKPTMSRREHSGLQEFSGHSGAFR